MLSELQMRKLTQLFYSYDLARSGFVAEKDYRAMVSRNAQVRGWAPASVEYQTLETKLLAQWTAFEQAMDTDHDRRISLTEWLIFYAQLLAQPEIFDILIVDTANFMVELMDTDGDGFMTVCDTALAYRIWGIDEALAATGFRHLDVDGDGKLSKADMAALIEQFYFSDDPAAAGNWLVGPLVP